MSDRVKIGDEISFNVTRDGRLTHEPQSPGVSSVWRVSWGEGELLKKQAKHLPKN